MQVQCKDYKVLTPFKKGVFRKLVHANYQENILYVGKFYRTNRDGLVEVKELISSRIVKVRFVNTGFEREVLICNMNAGKCADTTIKERAPVETYKNLKMQSNGCGEFTVLEKHGRFYTVVFTDTGYKTKVCIDNAKVGKVKDPYFKSRYGVAYFGEDVKCSYKKFAYTLWSNMLKRCYSKTDKKGYFGKGKNVFVNDRWLSFNTFVNDLPKLNNFDKWLEGQIDKSKIQYNLDKDFAYVGCAEYSLDTCQFIDESLNKSTTSCNPLSALNIAKYNHGKGN